MRVQVLLGAALAVGLAFTTGCPGAGGGGGDELDAGGGGGDGTQDAGMDGGGQGGDAGQDAGPPPFRCKFDDDCSQKGFNLRCEVDGGCIAATTCSFSGQDPDQCDPDFDSVYCDQFSTLGCRCVRQSNDAGVCWRRHGECDECTRDEQCGVGGNFDPVGKCSAFPGDNSGKKYCTRRAVAGNCSLGFLDDGTGYCRPQNLNCANPGCRADTDCNPGQLCNNAPAQRGICVPACAWDFDPVNPKLADPGCPEFFGSSRGSCWVDAETLSSRSPFFGRGRCKPECTSDSVCTNTALNPHAGPNLRCLGEVLGDGGLGARRCRPPGCMDDRVCQGPGTDAGEPYNGYCDRDSFQCRYDCRVGRDPVNDDPFTDCSSGYKCADAGSGLPRACLFKKCFENGGPFGCEKPNQFCCGYDRDFNGVVDPCPDAGIDPRTNCYTVPSPPWCSTCQSNEECNGVGSPKLGSLPSLCLADQRPDMSQANICFHSTTQDGALADPSDPSSPYRFQAGCPSSYRPVQIRWPECTGDADCNLGQPTPGRCITNPFIIVEDGGQPAPKLCICTTPGQVGGCPNPVDGGLGAVCPAYDKVLRVDAGEFLFCIASVVCAPAQLDGRSLHFHDAGQYNGCGL